MLPKDSKLDPASDDFKKNAQIGSQFGSALYKWLEENGYHNAARTGDDVALVRMMSERKSLDALYIVDEVFKYAAGKIGLDVTQCKTIPQISMKTGVYISKQYLARHPGFMGKLNNAIAANK